MNIIPGDLSDPRIIELLRIHLTRARAESPPESVHALDLTDLKTPDISLWAAWDGEVLMGIGALKQLASAEGEVKSMHTAAARRGRGVGSAVLGHLITVAKARGWRRLRLETGAQSYFQPARALYQRHGFVECGPFAHYVLDPNSVYLSLTL